MNKLYSWTLSDIAAALQKREVSVKETVSSCLERINDTEPYIQALVTEDGESALRLAEEYDSAGPDPERPLWGVPVTIKDAISTKGLRTTAASRILEDFIPIYDAFVVQRLREAGAIIIGKNNMDEFAMGSSTENSAFKKTRNPWNLQHVPGGSSGGSAASVSACQCFASLGSDTGGSIRQPAAFCGCVGLKPTYGRVSRYGLFAFASSLDQIGPITRTVKDSAIMLNVIAGHDSRDNTSSQKPVEDYARAVAEADLSFRNLRIGIPWDFFGDGLSDEVALACNSALRMAQDNGAELVPVNLPEPDICIAAYYIIAMAEASSNLARYDGVRYGRRAHGVASLDELYLQSRSQGFGQEVKRRIMLGSYVLSAGYYDAYFKKAAQARRVLYNKYCAALEQCDAICMPVAPITAWQLGTHEQDPLAAYLLDAFTLPINLAGLPAISIPVGVGSKTGLPIGFQLAGKHFGEAKLLAMAAGFENLLGVAPAPAISCSKP